MSQSVFTVWFSRQFKVWNRYLFIMHTFNSYMQVQACSDSVMSLLYIYQAYLICFYHDRHYHIQRFLPFLSVTSLFHIYIVFVFLSQPYSIHNRPTISSRASYLSIIFLSQIFSVLWHLRYIMSTSSLCLSTIYFVLLYVWHVLCLINSNC